MSIRYRLGRVQRGGASQKLLASAFNLLLLQKSCCQPEREEEEESRQQQRINFSSSFLGIVHHYESVTSKGGLVT